MKKKIIVLISSYPTRNRELKKKRKKFQKIKKHHYGFISSQNGLGDAEKERKKNYCFDQFLPNPEQRIPKKQQITFWLHFKQKFRSVPTRRVTENSKKIAKKFKKLKNTIMASFQAIIGWKRSRMRENKNYRSDPYLTDA